VYRSNIQTTIINNNIVVIYIYMYSYLYIIIISYTTDFYCSGRARRTRGRRVWTIRRGAVSAGGFRHRVLSRFVILEDIGASPRRDRIRNARTAKHLRYTYNIILRRLTRRVEQTTTWGRRGSGTALEADSAYT